MRREILPDYWSSSMEGLLDSGFVTRHQSTIY